MSSSPDFDFHTMDAIHLNMFETWVDRREWSPLPISVTQISIYSLVILVILVNPCQFSIIIHGKSGIFIGRSSTVSIGSLGGPQSPVWDGWHGLEWAVARAAFENGTDQHLGWDFMEWCQCGAGKTPGKSPGTCHMINTWSISTWYCKSKSFKEFHGFIHVHPESWSYLASGKVFVSVWFCLNWSQCKLGKKHISACSSKGFMNLSHFGDENSLWPLDGS